jgi:O-methyltransferase involved in polyketide biosynthesis
VPETLLWTLYHRALEARRDGAVLDDPKAIELVDALDYPFAERFGGHAALAQAQALRVRRFDTEVRRFLAANPDGTVVALGEGLETQFWRVDNGRVDWITVDVPEAIELRERLLPPGERQTLIARSAFDESWMDEADGAAGVLITAQGLFMYFEYAGVERLVHACRAPLPGRHAGVRRGFPLARRAQPEAAARRVPAAAVAVGDRPRQAPPARCRAPAAATRARGVLPLRRAAAAARHGGGAQDPIGSLNATTPTPRLVAHAQDAKRAPVSRALPGGEHHRA